VLETKASSALPSKRVTRFLSGSLFGSSCLAVLSIITFWFVPARAQSQPTELQVGVYAIAPFVMNDKGELSGFSIELWNAIAARLNVKSTYRIAAEPAILYADMRAKRIDLVASPVFITSERDEEFDFSHPVMETGLGIMVLEAPAAGSADHPLRDLLKIFLSPTILVWLGVGLLLILIPAHIIWFLDRRNPDGVIASEKYFPGIFHAMFWAASALISQVQGVPGQWLARLFALVWMFGGVVFVAFYTAQLTSTLTVEKIRGAIQGPSDLPGKQIGTIAKSLAVDYLRRHGAVVEVFAQPDQMFNALLQEKVDAVVTAAPVLLYYASHEGKGRARVVGPQFNKGQLAIVFQLDSPLRKRVNGALIGLRENGTYQQLYEKWFGSE
jgi:polar amino acid transport system substrate-binding protein